MCAFPQTFVSMLNPYSLSPSFNFWLTVLLFCSYVLNISCLGKKQKRRTLQFVCHPCNTSTDCCCFMLLHFYITSELTAVIRFQIKNNCGIIETTLVEFGGV